LTMCMCAVGVEEGATTTTRLNTPWRSAALTQSARCLPTAHSLAWPR
jgi:hypothetical protein